MLSALDDKTNNYGVNLITELSLQLEHKNKEAQQDHLQEQMQADQGQNRVTACVGNGHAALSSKSVDAQGDKPSTSSVKMSERAAPVVHQATSDTRLKVTTDEKPKKTGGRSPDLRGQKALDFISVFVRLRNKDFDKLSKEKQAKLMLPELEQIDIKMDLSSIFVKIKNFRQQFNQMKTKNKGHPVACDRQLYDALKRMCSSTLEPRETEDEPQKELNEEPKQEVEAGAKIIKEGSADESNSTKLNSSFNNHSVSGLRHEQRGGQSSLMRILVFLASGVVFGLGVQYLLNSR